MKTLKKFHIKEAKEMTSTQMKDIKGGAILICCCRNKPEMPCENVLDLDAYDWGQQHCLGHSYCR